MTTSVRPIVLRWIQFVDTTAGPSACWPWRGAVNEHGYGVINHDGRMLKAHRVALEIAGRAPGPDAVVIHDCDNPPCVNPKHLHAGTQAENMADCRAKGRSMTGTKNPTAKLHPEAVRELRRRAAAGEKYKDLAAEFGTSPSNISRIVKRQGWSHVA